MKILQPRGKVVDYPAPGARTAFSLAAYRISRDLIQPRLRENILPPTIVGTSVPTGSALLWLTNDDRVGFMFGTALTPPSPESTRALFQDGQERIFTKEAQFKLTTQLFNVGVINYFKGDEVIARIHSERTSGEIVEILDSPADSARVRLLNGQEILQPFSHMVLTGPNLTIPDFQCFYNVVSGIGRWLDMELPEWLGLDVDDW
ncbi:MAG: hypothetical protein GF311_27635, partial [Candidatus Lokiarchaeota archaeon]|nr:hypothetical protein [Candidatus Lokiarchaeota archaeon]